MPEWTRRNTPERVSRAGWHVPAASRSWSLDASRSQHGNGPPGAEALGGPLLRPQVRLERDLVLVTAARSVRIIVAGQLGDQGVCCQKQAGNRRRVLQA